jgi:hypothetical protein
MKKAFLIAAMCCLIAIPAFAAGESKNLQKIYPVDSEVYQAITFLYLDQGYGLPSTTGPWSGDELTKMLDKIDPSRLKGGAVETYNFAITALDEGHKAVKFGLKTTVEGYYHTNTTDFVKESQWIRGFDERNPILDIVLETWPSEHFYGFSSLSVGNSRYNSWDNSYGAASTLWGKSALTTNIPLLAPATLTDLDFNIPYRAFGSIGGSGWSAEIGRDKYSWGPGVSGNFVLGDHILYHNMGRLTTYGKNFKYTFATSFFPYPEEYYPIIDGTTGDFINGNSQCTLATGLNMFIGHRLEWKMFQNKVGFTLTEAIMYQSADNTLDLRVLSPTAIFHNYYIRNNANSILSAEADFTPFKYVNLYGQVVIDEFALPGEPVPGVDNDALPNGYGFMAGAKASVPFGKGMFFGSAEWAKTDPYLYLRDIGTWAHSQGQGEYGINWVVALREFSQGTTSYTEEFLGYQYGGDAIVYNGNFGYKQFGKWSLEGNVFYMIHGTHDKWTTWSEVGSGVGDVPNVTTPTTHHYTANNGDLNADERDCASYTFVAGARGSYTVLKGLEIFGQVDYVHITNPGNISTNPATWDVQVTAGVKYSL